MSVFIDRLAPSIGVIRISNLQSLNALSSSILGELTSSIETLESDSDIRVIIITGEGKAFVAGADIFEMKDMTAEQANAYALFGSRLFQKIETLDKVTIAAINGFALGGGCELAMACDIRIASENAKLGQPEVGLGIIPGFSGIRRMIELIGEAKAKEYIFSGRIFDAQEGERVGLINKIVSPDLLMAECQKMAEEIASKSFHAVITSKRVMNAMKRNIDEIVLEQSKRFADCFHYADQKKGMLAFLKKEKPLF